MLPVKEVHKIGAFRYGLEIASAVPEQTQGTPEQVPGQDDKMEMPEARKGHRAGAYAI